MDGQRDSFGSLPRPRDQVLYPAIRLKDRSPAFDPAAISTDSPTTHGAAIELTGCRLRPVPPRTDGAILAAQTAPHVAQWIPGLWRYEDAIHLEVVPRAIEHQ